MKILITTDWYEPTINGVVTSVLNLRKELVRRGHDVRVLTLSQTIHSFEADGVTYIGSVGAGVIYPGTRIKTALFSSFVQNLINWQPNIIHSQCEFSTFLIARRISKSLNIHRCNGWQYEDENDFLEKLTSFFVDTKIQKNMKINAAGLAHQIFSSATFAEKVEHIYFDVLRDFSENWKITRQKALS